MQFSAIQLFLAVAAAQVVAQVSQQTFVFFQSDELAKAVAKLLERRFIA